MDGYRLEAGANTDEQLKLEVRKAKAFIGLITPQSMASAYVLFELGARWGADLHMIPLLAGVEPHLLEGPLKGINAISAGNISQLHQLVQNLGSRLQLQLQTPASYTRYAEKVIESVRFQQGATLSVQTEVRRPVPNIVRLRPRIAQVFVNSRLGVFQESEPWSGEPAALAVYENAPMENIQIGSASDVAGYITYRDKKGEEIQDLRVQNGCWLEANERVHFPPLTKHELMIALKTSSGGLALHGSPKDKFPAKITQEKLNVEVKLVSNKGDILLTNRYLLVLTKDKFSLTEAD